MSKEKTSYKNELKVSLVKNSLIYVLVISGAVLLITLFIIAMNVMGTVKGNCGTVKNALDKSVSEYQEELLRSYDSDYFQKLKSDRAFLSSEYKRYQSVVAESPLKADFYVINKDFDILLQSGYPANFKLSNQQKTKEWSAFGRIWSNPKEVVVEVTKDFKGSFDLGDLVIGKGIYSGGEVIGYVVFAISETTVNEESSQISSDIVVTHVGNSVLSASSVQYSEIKKYLDGEFGVVQYSDSVLYYAEESLLGGFQIYSFLDLSGLKRSFLFAVLLMVVILMIVVVALVKASDKFSRQKTEYLDDIMNTFRQVEAEGLSQKMKEYDILEFDEISQEYNKMLDDIKGLMDLNEKKTQENFISTIKQLEMQLNSHFIFNTLENIRFLIKIVPDKAMECIVNLSQILRYSINNDNQYVTLKEDVEYTKRYLEILKLRFGSRLNFSIEVTGEANSYIVPKLIIQPIIENAVKYAYGDREVLNISVFGEIVNGELLVSISDDGIGLSMQELENVRKNITAEYNKSNHIGMHNVDKRLRIIYGENYGLTIKSRKDKGTTVKMMFGKVKR